MNKTPIKKKLSKPESADLLAVLKTRFEKNSKRHKGLVWVEVEKKLIANPSKLWSLSEMEKTGGEPDVVAFDKKTGEFVFFDCSPETPVGRRSVCFDKAGLDSRKENVPEHNAVDMATAMGTQLLTETEYKALQKLATFDAKTSSWIQTPDSIRKLGGALFADYRYGNVFVYHNGAQSYYAVRGFRCVLRV